jgi:hypothetical protein
MRRQGLLVMTRLRAIVQTPNILETQPSKPSFSLHLRLNISLTCGIFSDCLAVDVSLPQLIVILYQLTRFSLITTRLLYSLRTSSFSILPIWGRLSPLFLSWQVRTCRPYQLQDVFNRS